MTGGGSTQVESLLRGIAAEGPDLNDKLEALCTIRDATDYLQSPDGASVSSQLLSAFLDLLRQVSPDRSSSGLNQKIRNTALDILHRTPINESFRPFALQLYSLLLQIIRDDNEDNAVLCLKILIDLYKAFKPLFEDKISEFMEIITEIYQRMPSVVRNEFDRVDDPPMMTRSQRNAAQSPRAASPSVSVDTSDISNRTLNPGMESFKVVAECPIIVVLLFQSHKELVADYLSRIAPLVIHMASLDAESQERAHAEAAGRNSFHIGIVPGMRSKAVYCDFLVAQVKTMSFLAYLLRGHGGAMKAYQSNIPKFVVRILKSLPSEMSSARKELLVATRHILSTEFRSDFISDIDDLLEEKILVGDGVTAQETLRPLAYSMLADLLHHVRADLTEAQILKTIRKYCANLHDLSMPVGIQTMSAKLILNMIDRIMKLPIFATAQSFLMLILANFIDKFRGLNMMIDRDSKLTENEEALPKSGIPSADVSPATDYRIYASRPIKTPSVICETDIAKDGRFLFKTLMIGLKTIIFGLKACNAPPPTQTEDGSNSHWNDYVRGLSVDDVRMFRELLKQGLRGFRLYHLGEDKHDSSQTVKLAEKGLPADQVVLSSVPSSREEKDALETFATIFIHLDPAIFTEIWDLEFETVFQLILQIPSLIYVPQHLLANETTSSNFEGITLRYMAGIIPKLGDASTSDAAVMLRLMRLSFMAVTMFPDNNEPILQPYVAPLIIQSMQHSNKCKNGSNYFLLLKYLFRGVGGGRFDILYREVMPLLQVLLECLNVLLISARKSWEKELYAELCLTVPVRLSVLLPYMGFLMRPLVVALRGSPDLVNQGLRTLELCLDNLTQEFLDPILAPHIHDIMSALWSHLRPLPHNHQHSHNALKILGKLGGRNRKFLSASQDDSTDDPVALIHLAYRFHGATSNAAFPLQKFIGPVCEILVDRRDIEQQSRLDAFLIVENCLKTTLGDFPFHRITENWLFRQQDVFKNMTVEEPNSDRMEVDQEAGSRIREPTFVTPAEKVREIAQKTKCRTILRQILQTLFALVDDALLESRSKSILMSMSSLLLASDIHYASSGDPEKEELHPVALDLREAFVDATVSALSSTENSVGDFALTLLKAYLDRGFSVVSNPSVIASLASVSALATKSSHSCFQEDWFVKQAGERTIAFFTSYFEGNAECLKTFQLGFTRALLYVLKDGSSDLPSSVRTDAADTIKSLISICQKGLKSSDIALSTPTELHTTLILDLSNSNQTVREVIQESLQLLVDSYGCSLPELLEPYRSMLLGPIFQKPLRALPFSMQISHIDAVTYCLSLKPNFLDFSEELQRLLHEALALADAEDEALVTVNRTSQYKSVSALVKLRVVCIKLLSTALNNFDFTTPQQAQTRGKIIGVFFKSLYVKAQEIVDVANKGLKNVLSQNQKLPKELLQGGLRPILMNLSDHKRLTVAGLEGLARLLELLTNYFKVEIGRKLLDHMKAWADPQSLSHMASKTLEDQPTMKIISSILNIFHLLPPQANQFLEELFTSMLFIEEGLRRTQSSPLRVPMAKYLNRYASDAWQFFLAHLRDNRIVSVFCDMVGMKEADELRLYISSKVSELAGALETCCHEHNDIGVAAICRIVYAIFLNAVERTAVTSSLAPFMNTLIGSLPKCVDVANSSSKSMHGYEGFFWNPVVMVIQFFLRHSEEIGDIELFKLIEGLGNHELHQAEGLKSSLRVCICGRQPVQSRKNLIIKCLRVFSSTEYSQGFKIFVLKDIINPVLFTETRKSAIKDSVFDRSLIETVQVAIWKPALADYGEDRLCMSDQLRMELLQLSTFLIQHDHESLSEYRKDVIKFAWNYIKLDDIVTKHAAYVAIAAFIVAFETPAKIVTQIYVALLRANQSESKNIVKQALDTISPVLPVRIPATSDNPSPPWAKWPRRIISEDSNNLSTLCNVYHFLIRNPKLSTYFGDSVLPTVGNNLQKLSFQANATSESRLVAVELVELVTFWTFDIESSGTRELTLPPFFKEMIVSFLVRFTCLSPDLYSRGGLNSRTVKLLENILKHKDWAQTSVKLQMFEKILMQMEIQEQNMHTVANALKTLSIVISTREDGWVVSNLGKLKTLLEKSLRYDNPFIQDAFQPVLRKIFQSCGNVSIIEVDEYKEVISEFKGSIVSSVQDILSNATCFQPAILSLDTMTDEDAAVADSTLPSLVKVFAKLAKELITNTAAASSSAGTNAQMNAPQPPNTTGSQSSDAAIVDLLSKAMTVLERRVASLGDQRRFFLGALIQLIEKSQHTTICMQIVEMVRRWVFEKTGTFPTTKEKVLLLLKMTNFETRVDRTLINALLSVIIDIYEDPGMASTELTVRLEQAFLIGTRAETYHIRHKFMSIFNHSMSTNVFTRLNYILGVQNWELTGASYWIVQANQLLIGSITDDRSQSEMRQNSEPATSTSDQPPNSIPRIVEDAAFIWGEKRRNVAFETIDALGRIQFHNRMVAHDLWICLLSHAWENLSKRDRRDLAKTFVNLLAKDYHIRQMEQRPNVIKTLLDSCLSLSPKLSIPPHLVKYAGVAHGAHYTAIGLLEQATQGRRLEEESKAIKHSTLDALVECYASIAEDDMFYGTWRRRCQYIETNAAISYEQNGMWDRAQSAYESAQVKARTGVLPFSESEYNLWEDHWILCTQKLQQWEVLNDLAKHEGYCDLMLECAWRLSDWSNDRDQLESSIRSLSDSPSPRRYTFEAFMALQKSQARIEPIQEFNRILDEGMQVALRKWHQLPATVGNSHIPILQNFQQFVELHEASSIYSSLSTTHAQNMQSKAMEIKNVLQTWRDRLPNLWDDINIWSDLVAWRQLVFGAINKVYLPLAPQGGSNASNNNATSFLYRGYHETAWIINRFAHVARKHQLPEVCISQLTRIYTLPNIEIQEAFLKLREQAKCHYQNPNETQQGLEVISNTNLMYFGVQQKAEFFTLKGMFLAKLKQLEEANQAFATAVQIDLTLAKAWAQWGRYNDMLHRENSSDINSACNAVSCYLQAAGLYQNGKARKVLSRVLWLLSFDDAQGSISKAFETYRGEVPVWHWITFVPQLLTALSHKEARHVRHILARIAKTFPQALHFQLRTTRDDYTVIKRQALAAAQSASSRSETMPKSQQDTQSSGDPNDSNGQAETDAASQKQSTPRAGSNTPSNANNVSGSNASPAPSEAGSSSTQSRQPWEHVDDIMSFLKTAYPLLALTMETMVDQIQTRFKSPPDEDAYRLIVALLNDGVQYIGRIGSVNESTMLPAATQANISRFAESVLPKHIKKAFEEEFVQAKPNLQEYVDKLRRWRDRFEFLLDQREPVAFLENISPWLSDFQYTRFDDVEVPGQYLLHKDNNNDFVRIARFLPDVGIVRGQGICYRRLTMRGHDGSTHPFAVQYPAARHCRREERIVQLFRILDGVLSRKRESRRRDLSFELPPAIPLAPHIRIVKDTPSLVSFQSIFEDHCNDTGIHKDDPLKSFAEKVRTMSQNLTQPTSKDTPSSKSQNDARRVQQRKEMIAIRTEILESVQQTLAPNNVFTTYFQKCHSVFEDFWVFRKRFTLQYAALTFMTYVMSINLRFPHKFFVSKKSGSVMGTELLPAMASNNPIFFNGEAVPFRFTPNIQHLIGPIGVEGVFSCALMAVARCLSEPEFELDQYLDIFVRDELIWWFTQQHRPIVPESQLKEKIGTNVEQITRRVSSLSQIAQGNLPANQTIIDLISQAVNPRYLAQMDQLWAAWI